MAAAPDIQKSQLWVSVSSLLCGRGHEVDRWRDVGRGERWI